ncbi:MAG: hypothetical protein K6A30_06700 [Lachnospiraceae bacterium]|nr:hypothetical protein [Lachnospiraceae bacterium]
MDQPVYTVKTEQELLHKFLFQDTIEFEKEKEEISNQRKELEEERLQLERDKREFDRRMEYEKKRMEREAELFKMKWSLLEKETVRLAEERNELNYKMNEFREEVLEGVNDPQMSCSLLFRGVTNELALKKRYKDLMKIYHPDNVAGDNNVVLEISKEYEDMKLQFRSRY